MPNTLVATVTRLPKSTNIYTRSPSSSILRRARPHDVIDSDSSSTSSLTRKNLRLHNALQSQNHGSAADVPDSIHIEVEVGLLSYASPSPSPDSSHDLEISNETNHTPFPSGLDSTDMDTSESRPNHVHFRPRVRITSGISRHRHKHSPQRASNRGFPFTRTPDSSLCSSPSSSISAPLRSRTDDEADKPGWGPLGQRVALLSRDRRRPSWERRRKKQYDDHVPACEHTPLLRPRVQSPMIYTEGHREEYISDSDREEEARVSSEIDQVFGTMPRRLLNYHWWWWQLEPLLCCRCLDDSDVVYNY